MLIGKNEIEIRQLFVEMESSARKFGLQINQEKTKYMIVERKNILRQTTGHLKRKNYKFERVENFKYLGVTLQEDNNHQIHLQERIKNANKTHFMFKQGQICVFSIMYLAKGAYRALLAPECRAL